MRLLLIVLGQQAWWYRSLAGRWSTPFVEPAGVSDGDLSGRSQCPWLTRQNVTVELILDSGLQEIELRPLARGTSGLAAWLDCRAVRRRRVPAQSGLAVERLRLAAHRRALGIRQTVLPVELQHWLRDLQERQGVLFTSADTVADRLTVTAGPCARLLRGPASEPRALLYVLQESGICRHLFYVSGRLCCSRLIPARDETAVLLTVQDTLDHLTSIGVDTRGLLLYTLGVSVDARQRLGALSPVAGQASLDAPDTPAATGLLAAWLASLTPPRTDLLTGLVTSLLATGTAAGPVAADYAAQVNTEAQGSPGASAGLHLASRTETDGGAAPGPCPPGHTTRPAPHPPPGPAPASDLSPADLLRRWRLQQRGLRRLGLSLAALAALLVIATFTGADLADRWQARVATAERIRQLRLRSSALQEQTLGLNPTPLAAERSVVRRRAFADDADRQPSAWLARLAAAITAHDVIRIDALEWYRQAPTATTAGPVAADAAPAACPPQLAGEGHWRRALPSTASATERLVVRLQGSLSTGLSLRQRRDHLVAFIAALESLEDLDAVHIERSPLDDYAAGSLAFADTGPGPLRSRFDVCLLWRDADQPAGETPPAAMLPAT